MQESLTGAKAVIGDIIQLNYLTFSQEQIKVSCHEKPLVKILWGSLKQKQQEYTSGWLCDGRHINGCKSGKSEYDVMTDAKEFHYHCKECKFDYCAKCFDIYGDDHSHKLEKLTLKQVQEAHNNEAYMTGWTCDGARHATKCPQQDGERNVLDIIYHDAKSNYDLCETCADLFKIE